MSKYRIYICGGDEDLVAEACGGGYHTVAPKGYAAWHDWAAEMAKTHVQKQCPTCGLWAIWEPKRSLLSGAN